MTFLGLSLDATACKQQHRTSNCLHSSGNMSNEFRTVHIQSRKEGT